MASELDMSLDDIIKSKKSGKSTRGRGRGRGGFGASGPLRRHSARTFRSTPYPKPAVVPSDGVWQHDMFNATVGAPYTGGAPLAIETGTKLFISNLDFGVSYDDIKELFSEVGDLKKCAVHYDKSGRSKGTADVVFTRKADALAAMARYNNVQLDGKPMKIELIGTNLTSDTPVVQQPPVPARSRLYPAQSNPLGVVGGPSSGFSRFGRGKGFAGGRGRSFRGGRGGGRFKKGGNSEPLKSQEELDAELDLYHAKKTDDMEL